MKIAIISDVHGNYPALLAVISDAIRNNVDQFIFVGDYIFDLPYPNEVTELIRSLKNAYVIQGNKEGYLKWLRVENLKVEEKRVSYDLEQNINFSKSSEICKKGQVWSELVFLAASTGEDVFSDFFKLAQSIARNKNETGNFLVMIPGIMLIKSFFKSIRLVFMVYT